MRILATVWLLFAFAALFVSATGDRGILPDYTGFIRVQGGKFVDADCNQFPVTGLNACVPFPSVATRGADQCGQAL